MPELPEVEIVRESLERWVKGRLIFSARVPDSRLRGSQSRAAVEKALEGARVRAVRRRGKFLLFELSGKRPAVLAHLGMTGRFVRLGRNEPSPKFPRVELELSRGERLVFSDARRLGQFRLIGPREKQRLEALGVEPLSRDFDGRRLGKLLEKSSRPIKLFLMDQNRIAGIGNIQAAEALFRAGIHPERVSASLAPHEVARLARSIRRALKDEIRRSRSEELVYLQEGASNHFLAYGRAGEPCFRCGGLIRRFVQGGRSTYYCPACQPKRGRK